MVKQGLRRALELSSWLQRARCLVESGQESAHRTMPNTFAYIALLSWPVVVLFLFRRLPRAEALIASILGGYLLLPYGVEVNPPVLPTFDKTLIPALSALVAILLMPEPRVLPASSHSVRGDDSVEKAVFVRHRETVPRRAYGTSLVRPKINARQRRNLLGIVLLLLYFLNPFVTIWSNPDAYDIGPRILQGLRLYDAFSMGLSSLVALLPFLLAERYLATQRAHQLLLRGLVVWGLFYTLPTLFEIRMSPQLARWTYGFLAQSFLQTMRDGGFRPVVFLEHGLWLAIFLAMAALAAAALWRTAGAQSERQAGRWLLALTWLLGTLVLCHSLGALLIAIIFLLVTLRLTVGAQLCFASVLACMVLSYPALRGANLIPYKQVVSMVNSVSPERAASLEFRLKNEEQLLAHARKKPLAGWGGYGRSRVYDPRNGRDLSTTDGAWIIIVGSSGWLGYIAHFGLLTAPIFLLTLRRRKLAPNFATSGLAIVLSANLADMIPNATLTPLTWMIAGALAGRLRLATQESSAMDQLPETGRKYSTSLSRPSSRVSTPNQHSARNRRSEY